MENIDDKHMRLARTLLNLGHSYLHTVDIENSEDKCEEQKKQKDQVLEKTDKEHNDKVIEQELDIKTKQDIIKEIPQQLNRDIDKFNKKLPVKIDKEKQEIEIKVANNDIEPKLNIDLSKGFNYTVQKKSECAVDFNDKVQEELSPIQKKFDIDEQQKNDKEYQCNEEIIKGCENENQEIEVKLQVQVPPDFTFPPGKEIELYLKLRVDHELFQQKLNIKNQELGEKQQNIDEEHLNTFDKNIKHVVHSDIPGVNNKIQIIYVEANIPQDIEEDIQNKINEGYKQNMGEDIQLELNENLEVQQNVIQLEQEDDNDIEKIIQEDTTDDDQTKLIRELNSLLYEVLERQNKIPQDINERKELQEYEKSVVKRIAELTKKVKKIEFENVLNQYDELYRKHNEEFNQMISSAIKDKFFEKLNQSFIEELAPFYKEIDDFFNNDGPTKFNKNNDKISSKFNENPKESIFTFEEIQEKSDKSNDKFEEESDVDSDQFEDVPEESDIEMKEFEDEVVQDESDIGNEDEESYVDVEGFDDKEQENLLSNLQIGSEIYAYESDGRSLEESEDETIELDEDKHNIVTEIVNVVESSSEEHYTPINEGSSSVDGLCTIEEESSSVERLGTVEESSSVEELSTIEESDLENEISSADDELSSTDIQQKINQEGQLRSIGSEHELEGDVQDKNDNDKPQKFEDLQLQMELENIQDLDEIPLKLKIQQEQFEEKLHQQMKTFQSEFYKNSKLEYDKEQQLKGNILNDPVYDRQQKLFYEIKDEFEKIIVEYKGLSQKKMIEALQQNVDVQQLMKEFPEEFVLPNIQIEDLHKEVVELQRECTELEPEFSYNIPLVVDEKKSKKKTKKVNYDLYQKLLEIHKKKLCFFADSKEWPEKYLYPSSLLDDLFNDPSEVSPNVFVITLFSVDIGYSVKISMKKNKPPVEMFYTYAEDTILDFVEKEKLPPSLLHLFDEAEPCLFYNGRVIAEIHNKNDEKSVRVYRILLHPHALSIQSDVDRYIAKHYPTNCCSYDEKLRLESKFLQLNFPLMCMDSSPIAGLTVQLQHQLLSRRTITLNPLKVAVHDSSKFDEMSKSHKMTEFLKSLKLIKDDTASDNVVYHLLWKFDFRIETFKLIKLYIFVVTETQEYSMLLCMNSKIPNAQKMRFKINLETNKLKPYIDVILEILKQKVNPNILVAQRYKSDDKSVPRTVVDGPLLNDKIFEPTPADFCQILDELLENIHPNKCNQKKTDVTKKCLKVNKEMQSKEKHFGIKRLLSKFPEIDMDKKRMKQVQASESKKSIPHIVESSNNTVIVDSKSLKSSTIPIDIGLDINTISLPEECLTSIETNSKVEPSLTVPKSVVSLDDNSINVVHKKLHSISAQEITPVSGGSTTVMSVVPRYKTIFSSAALNNDYRLASKNGQRFEDHNVRKDVQFKPVIQSNTDHTTILRKNDVSIKNCRTPLYSPVKANYGSESSSSYNTMKNITVIKHVNANSIRIKGPEIPIKNEGLPMIADLTEDQFSNEPNATQFFYQETTQQLNDGSTTNLDRLSNLQVIPNPVDIFVPSSLDESDDTDQDESPSTF